MVNNGVNSRNGVFVPKLQARLRAGRNFQSAVLKALQKAYTSELSPDISGIHAAGIQQVSKKLELLDLDLKNGWVRVRRPHLESEVLKTDHQFSFEPMDFYAERYRRQPDTTAFTPTFQLGIQSRFARLVLTRPHISSRRCAGARHWRLAPEQASALMVGLP